MLTPTHQVKRFYSAVAAGGPRAALAIYGDRIEWDEAAGMRYQVKRPYSGGARVTGRVLSPIGADIEHLTLDIERVVDRGRQVAALERYRGMARASRRSIDQSYAHVRRPDSAGAALELQRFADRSGFTDAVAP